MKENKLEKKTNNEYKWYNALIPYSWMFRKYRNNKGSHKESVYTALNSAFYTSLILLSLTFFYMKSSTGSAKPSEWSKIQQNEKQTQQQNSYRQQFYELDKNLDGVIDSTEFIYRK